MKVEELNIKCPECGSTEKRISRRRNPKRSSDACYIPHIPQGSVGVIRCTDCGHLFEYCKESKMPVEVKKLIID
jgi:Cys-rich peptide (TIGR04165 family)